CPDISYPKYPGQRPHELLGQLFKEQSGKTRSLIKAAYSTANRLPVNRFLRPGTIPDGDPRQSAVSFRLHASRNTPGLRNAHSTDHGNRVNDINPFSFC
ncbi:hypothetical protein, partial [Marinobacter sp.]|uniref:hypothetical protein n=1 Tax=Marinobacter sp. TaxID=50741 RepID=UPI002B459829